MATGTYIKIEGAEQFARQLQTLGDKPARKVIASALRSAGLPAKNAMKRKLLGLTGSPRKSIKGAIDVLSQKISESEEAKERNWLKAMRNLVNSLGVVVRKHYTSGVLFAVIGPRVGYKYHKESNIFPAVLAKRIEMGHKQIPPRPFVRPALMETRAQMEEKLKKAIAKGIIREAKRLRKR